MSSWPSSDVSGASVTLPAPEVQAGQTLFSSSASYSILEFIGEGCFGKVAKCQNLATKETVAIKIIKKRTDFVQDTEKELSMLNVISILSADHTNVVKFYEQFEHMGQTCLAFEMLDISLYDLLQERDWNPLFLNEIRPIAKQLLVALDALKSLGILHTDIKPDNVMLVNTQDQPFRIKLIDFGAAIPATKVQPGLELQPIGYRAPEIALGFPFTEAIDVWGVGCVLAFLYLSENLFPVDCDYQMMKCMVEVLGQPEDHLLRAGKYTKYYFTEEEAAGSPTWRLMTPEEYTTANNVKPEERNSFMELPSSLDDLVKIYVKEEDVEFEDRRAFVDLMKGLLHLDGDQRISPCQALQHPFITVTHLIEHPDSRAYLTISQMMMSLTTSQMMMSDCPVEDSGDKINTSATSAAVSYNSPCTWWSDGISVLSSYDEDTVSRSSDETEGKDSYEDDPMPGTSDGGLLSPSCDEDPASWSSDGGLPSCSSDEYPTSCSSDGEKPTDSTVTASASSGRTNKLMKRIHRFFSQISATFCCCWRSTVED